MNFAGIYNLHYDCVIKAELLFRSVPSFLIMRVVPFMNIQNVIDCFV